MHPWISRSQDYRGDFRGPTMWIHSGRIYVMVSTVSKRFLQNGGMLTSITARLWRNQTNPIVEMVGFYPMWKNLIQCSFIYLRLKQNRWILSKEYSLRNVGKHSRMQVIRIKNQPIRNAECLLEQHKEILLKNQEIHVLKILQRHLPGCLRLFWQPEFLIF